MKRILVAGATGYLGRYVVKELKQRGYWVRALARPGKIVEGADEVFHANATNYTELKGICDSIDGVFSSLGITHQKDNVTYMDVDYGVNSHLLQEAQVSGSVQRFLFVTAARPELFPGNAILEAREKFISELRASSISGCVVRGTGFFSDMNEFLKMAQKGRVYLFGNGENKMNPVHGADLAQACVDQFEQDDLEIVVGGPDILTYNQIADIAFRVVEKPVKVTHISTGFMNMIIALVKPFSKRMYTELSFMTTATSNEILGDCIGTHTLEEHYRDENSKL